MISDNQLLSHLAHKFNADVKIERDTDLSHEEEIQALDKIIEAIRLSRKRFKASLALREKMESGSLPDNVIPFPGTRRATNA